MKRKFIAGAIVLGAWFLVADGYWMHKIRSYQQCVATAMMALPPDAAGQELDRLRAQCHATQSGINGLSSTHANAMAYWELLLLLPVADRFLL